MSPLVESVLEGWNATVLAYGQTGSGKTFTMGTAPGAQLGIVPCAVAQIYAAAAQPGFGDCSIAVSFIEMYQEDIRDLLADGAAHSSHSVSLRDVPGSTSGAAYLPDARLVTCASPAHVASVLARGASCRVTAATGMNAVSSRSHAVVTLHLTRTCEEGGVAITRRSKLHLVDLAGSERVKRTGAEHGGTRFAEGVQINRGLLALGNVISALGDDTRRRTGGHVPYRDSKLTRLLADALGGNSRTVFLACVSPSDASADETLSTLKYANRARNITNKAAREAGSSGAATAEEANQLRAALAAANAELARLRGAAGSLALVETGGRPLAEAAARAQRAEAALYTARMDVAQLKDEVALAQQEALHACVSRDAALMRLQGSLDGDGDKENDGQEAATLDVLSGHLRSLARLRSRVRRLTAQLLAAGVEPAHGEDEDEDGIAEEDDEVQLGPHTLAALSADGISNADTAREYEAHRAACTAQLDALDAALSASEEQQRTLSGLNAEASAGEVVAHYELLLTNMEAERTALLEERQRLLTALGDSAGRAPTTAKGGMSEQHLRAQLRSLEAKLGELQRKLRDAADAEAARKAMSVKGAALAAEVQRLKVARAELARRMERDAKAHIQAARQAALALGAERAQARKSAARAAQAGAQADKAEAVLRRKMEEVSAAQKTIAALRAARRSGSSGSSALPAEVEAKPTPAREPLAPIAAHGDGWMQAALASGPASGWNNVRSLQEARILLAAMAASSGGATAHIALAPAPAAGLSRAAAASRPKTRRVQRRWKNVDEPDSDDDASGSSTGNAASWDATARRTSSSEDASLDEVSSAAAGGAATEGDASTMALASFLRAGATPTGNKRPPFRLAPATPPPAAMVADAAKTPSAAAALAGDDDLLASARASRQRAASLLFSAASPSAARSPLRSLALNSVMMTSEKAVSPLEPSAAVLDC